MYGVSSGGVSVDLQAGLGFRPRFGQQPDLAPEPATVHQPPQPADAVVGLGRRSVPACSYYCSEWTPGISEALSGCRGQSSGQRRLPLWSHRPRRSGSLPIARANAVKSAPGRPSGSSASPALPPRQTPPLFLTLAPCQPLAHPRSIIYVPIGNPRQHQSPAQIQPLAKMTGNERK